MNKCVFNTILASNTLFMTLKLIEECTLRIFLPLELNICDKNAPYEFFLIPLTQHLVISYSFLQFLLRMFIVNAAKTTQGMHRKKMLRDLKMKLGLHRALNCHLITKSCLRVI